MRKFVVAVVLVVVAGLFWAYWPGNDENGVSEPANEQTQANSAATKRRGNPADQATARRLPQTSNTPDDAAGKSGGDSPTKRPQGQELIRRLIAMRAIESQMEVTNYLTDNAERAEKLVDEFCRRSKTLPPDEAPRGEPGDASRFMYGRVGWTSPEVKGELRLPEALTLKVRNKDWLSQISAAELQGLDFSWMPQLRKFSHWSLVASGEIMKQQYEYGVPIPNYVPLLDWVKLRLAQAALQNDDIEASRDVRHLAHLVESNGILIAHMIGIKMRMLEREAYDRAIAHGRSVGAWSPPEMSQLEQTRKVGRVASHFFFPGGIHRGDEQGDRMRPGPVCRPDGGELGTNIDRRIRARVQRRASEESRRQAGLRG